MPARAPPRTRSGGNTSPGRAGSTRPSTVAPMRRSGSATRRIGRRVSEASPTSSVSNGRPASRPISSRIVVPELPQSSAPAAAVRPAKPTPWTRASSPASTISTPSARSAAAVDRLSPPGRARAPRRRRPRAPRTAAPDARSTCRRAPGNSRATVPIAGPSASMSPPSSLLHYHVPPSLPILRERLTRRRRGAGSGRRDGRGAVVAGTHAAAGGEPFRQARRGGALFRQQHRRPVTRLDARRTDRHDRHRSVAVGGHRGARHRPAGSDSPAAQTRRRSRDVRGCRPGDRAAGERRSGRRRQLRPRRRHHPHQREAPGRAYRPHRPRRTRGGRGRVEPVFPR